MIPFVFAAALVAAASPSASPSATPSPVPTAKPVYQDMKWREIGPALPGGRASVVAGTAKDPNLYYAGAAGGGVWKTTDRGQTWQAVFEKEPVASIGYIAIDPNNEQTVWVGTGEGNPRNDVIPGGGVYESTDGGKSWKKMGLEKTRSITRLIIDPRNSNHIVVAALGDVFAPSADRGVYVTNDGGKSWKKTLYLSDRSGASDLAMDPKNPNVIFAGMWHFERKPWTTVSGGADDGLFKSTDGGSTWTKLTGHGLPEGTTGRYGLAIAPSDPNKVYALIESTAGVLWRSDDGGNNWTLVSKDTIVDQRPFYFSHVEVDPTDPNHVFGVSQLLVSSHDGGKTWHPVFNLPHGDLHDMWIAPNDPKRIAIAQDGGVSLSSNGGGSWFFARNLPIGEVYHVGVGQTGNPYWICGGWQDNNAWCGPSNSRNPSGLLNQDWINVNGGDGEWGIPDPLDPNIMWSDAQQGYVVVYNKHTRDGYLAIPYLGLTSQQFDLRTAKYRFNWDSPIAFAPWNGHIAWLGGNVVFQTTDRGRHWTTISPDLTLNEKQHQAPPGGPITHDVSSAENYNTILDIEGSTLHKGEIWVGTDDGQVQYTLDGGKHWRNVSPSAAGDHGAVETVAPSTTHDGTVYVSIDRHLLGDYKPHVLVTNDFGKTWRDIGKNLPDGTWYARSVRQDLHNSQIVYAGTETGMFISCDSGASWHDFKNNLPTVSVRDIRYQPAWDDMAIATHGRALYIMDDLRPLQSYGCQTPSQPFVIAPRTAYIYNLHSDDEGTYTDYAGENPAYGATFSYYQSKPGAQPPSLQIIDARGHVVRTISGMKEPSPFAPPAKPGASPQPKIPNGAGLQRFTWDFAADGPVKWNGAGKFFKGPDSGAQVPPGTYRYRMTVDGKAFSGSFVVKADPQTAFTQAELVQSYEYSNRAFAKFSSLDVGLNALDDVKAALEKAKTAAKAKNDTATSATIDAALAKRQALQDDLTANYQSFEDFIQRPGRLREDLQQLLQTGLVTPAALDLEKRTMAEYMQGRAAFDAYVTTLPSLNAALKAAGYGTVPVPKPLAP
ncbi:MAG TPA: hypothetical protein VFN49_07830 [Candidatus Aquilonibacter sp.]|nr:hypothetical protein [Candidatus Aquilonibacter sp.]